MDGSLITNIAGWVPLPLAVVGVGVVAYFLIHHLKDCVERRKEVHDELVAMRREMHADTQAMRKEIDSKLDEIKDGVAENRESVARLQGMLEARR